MSVLLFRALLWVSAGHPRSDFGLDSRSRRPQYQSCPVKCPVMGFPSAARSGVNTRRAATSVEETLLSVTSAPPRLILYYEAPTAVTNSSGSCSRRGGIVYSARHLQVPANLLSGSFMCPTLHFITLYLFLHFISSSFFFFFFLSLIKTFRNVSQIHCWGSSLST